MQETVGPYRLLRAVDPDGSATVYEAAAPDHQRLAVTVLAASCLSEREYDSVRAAFHAAAQIRHPNLVTPHEFGRDGTSLFIAAPLVDGETLAHYTARTGRLPPLQGLALLAQLFAALACAGQHGWVHSAIHPGHLLLARNGRLKVDGSAGIAAACARRPGHLDSPHHLAPEVRLGKRFDQRADLYSAAVVAYQLLTGALPWEGNGHPGRAGVRPVRSARPGLPAGLDDVFGRALAHDPDARYLRAEDLGSALHAVLGTPVWVRPPMPVRPAGSVAAVPRNEPPVRAHPVLAPALAAEPGLDPALPRRTAVGLLVGCAVIAFWTAGLWKAEGGQDSGERVAAVQAVEAPDSTAPRLPGKAPVGDAGPAPLPPPEAATAAATAAAAATTGPLRDGRQRQPAPPQAAEAPGRLDPTDRPRFAAPRAGQAPTRAVLRTQPRPARERPPPAKSASPERQCQSHEGFMREMCTVLHCATAEFRHHPICIRLHREAQARLQLAESRGVP